MALPADATKVHLDAATDDPKQARTELVDLIDKFNATKNALGNIVELDAGGGIKDDGVGNLDVDLAVDSGLEIVSEKLRVKAIEGLQRAATDAGLKLDVNGLTTENTIDGANDQVVFYDTTAGLHRKTAPYNIIPIATQGEAEAGTDNNKRMTPLRTEQAIAKQVGDVEIIQQISTISASNHASIDFDSGIDFTAYDVYMWHLINVVPASDDVHLQIKTSSDGGSTYDTSASNYIYNSNQEGEQTANVIRIREGTTAGRRFGSAAGESFDGVIKLMNPAGTSTTRFIYDFAGDSADGGLAYINGSGKRDSQADVDGVRFDFNIGNVESGTFRLYGIRWNV